MDWLFFYNLHQKNDELIQDLNEKYESKTQHERCEVKLEYESMKMKLSDDPEVFINRLEKLERRMEDDFGMVIKEDDIISKVLNSLPGTYDSLVDAIQVQMDTAAGVTLTSLKEQLRSKFQRLRKPRGKIGKPEASLNTTIKNKKMIKGKKSEYKSENSGVKKGKEEIC